MSPRRRGHGRHGGSGQGGPREAQPLVAAPVAEPLDDAPGRSFSSEAVATEVAVRPAPVVVSAPDYPDVPERKASCTLAQMRRFIKSRPYVPLHELRRRFEIGGIEDEVSAVTTGQGRLYVGLPPQEAAFLGELVTSGEIGYELLLDPTSPAVVGVFPMRPVARQ